MNYQTWKQISEEMKTNITFALIIPIDLTKVLCTRDTVEDYEDTRTDINVHLDSWEQQLRNYKERKPLSQG